MGGRRSRMQEGKGLRGRTGYKVHQGLRVWSIAKLGRHRDRRAAMCRPTLEITIRLQNGRETSLPIAEQ